MTVESQVTDLTASVNDLKDTVVTKKAVLDATVVDAQTATGLAQTAKTGAVLAKDQAGLFKDAAYTAAQSAASVTSYQDLTALAQSKADTAVDVFIYDTSKDSDGGAWRHRCTGASWYNEELNTATRGSRREFPALAVIVSTASGVFIYDADDPALPMWMVFVLNNNYEVAISAVNGIVTLGNKAISSAFGGNGLSVLNFAGDHWENSTKNSSNPWFYTEMPMIKSGAFVSWFLQSSSGPKQKHELVNYFINDVAMTVLPDAPIDPGTGLPVPTIAVATESGVSVINHDGFVANGAVGIPNSHVSFNPNGTLHSHWNDYHAATYPDQYQAGNWTYSERSFRLVRVNGASGAIGGTVSFAESEESIGTDSGLSVIQRTGEDVENGNPSEDIASCLVESDFTTGWMPGDIKGALLADTDETNLVGGNVLVNGNFESGADNWTPVIGATLTPLSGNRLQVSGGDSFYRQAEQQISVLPGERYRFTAVCDERDAQGARLRITDPAISGASILEQETLAGASVSQGVISFEATPVGSVLVVWLSSEADPAGTQIWSSVTVERVSFDRSVNAKGLTVNGTITRAPVATGAELVGYSGFSATNYLEQPYNPDLDFGTGDFCMMGWVKLAGGLERIFRRVGDSNVALAFFNSNGPFAAQFGNLTLNADAVTDVWANWAMLRRNGFAELYINGSLKASAPSTADFSDATAVTTVGNHGPSSYPLDGSLALLRITATAPTAEQIAKIYNDEKHLFRENAQCTLYGTSDAVTALAHDPDTGLLHVGTSQGRSVFQGLVRVDHDDEPVTTTISAANGMVVSQ